MDSLTAFFSLLVDSLRAAETPYVGVLYAGAIVTEQGPRILEFNCRFGDPEAQVLLSRLNSDLSDYLLAAAHGTLHTMPVLEWSDLEALGVVLASEQYPHSTSFGETITGVDNAELIPGVHIFHAGTDIDVESGELMTHGGRILCVVAVASSLKAARDHVYQAIGRIKFQGMRFRRDIGANGIPSAFDAEWRKSPNWEAQMRRFSEELSVVAPRSSVLRHATFLRPIPPQSWTRLEAASTTYALARPCPHGLPTLAGRR